MLNEDMIGGEAQKLALQILQDDEELVSTDDVLFETVLQRVVELLSESPEKLMSILYRIDVSEEKINDVIKNAPVASIATRIATLIIERMREKIETRKKYRDGFSL